MGALADNDVFYDRSEFMLRTYTSISTFDLSSINLDWQRICENPNVGKPKIEIRIGDSVIFEDEYEAHEGDVKGRETTSIDISDISTDGQLEIEISCPNSDSDERIAMAIWNIYFS